ncbi:uncharacterized protein G2W53_043504 [Senna tora]|uniref:Uncharacterized protein n=1 Tax=Senna tora TaxID=362788 RepID=A0A834VZZ5_9FABA|nr:uncharacterized protein G2W53_043504 [Senna tora]
MDRNGQGPSESVGGVRGFGPRSDRSMETGRQGTTTFWMIIMGLDSDFRVKAPGHMV